MCEQSREQINTGEKVGSAARTRRQRRQICSSSLLQEQMIRSTQKNGSCNKRHPESYSEGRLVPGITDYRCFVQPVPISAIQAVASSVPTCQAIGSCGEGSAWFCFSVPGHSWLPSRGLPSGAGISLLNQPSPVSPGPQDQPCWIRAKGLPAFCSCCWSGRCPLWGSSPPEPGSICLLFSRWLL